MKLSSEYVDEIKRQINEVGVEHLHGVLKQETSVVIDIREHEEFVTGHVESSVNFPRGVLEMKLHEHPSVSHHCDPRLSLEDLAGRDIYLICRSGGRSVLAAKSLQNMGFERVYSVAGGILSWSEKGYAVALTHEKS